MPQPNGAADAGVKSEPTAQSESASTAVTKETPTESTTSTTSSLMERLGVPAEVQQELASRKPKPETSEPAAEPEQSEPVAAQTEPETHEESDQDGSEPKPNQKWPEDVQAEFKKRVGKEARKTRQAREKAEQVELENERLRAQLEATHPVTVTPSQDDLLADVTDETQLAERVKIAKVGREFYRARLNGFTIGEGTPQERFVSPEEAAATLGRFEDVINEAAPRKQAELGQRREYDRIAKEKYPKLFDRTSEDYQRKAGIVQRFPWLANDPALNMFVGDYLRGAEARIAAENQAATSSGDPAADAILTAKAKTPPLAPNVPAAQRSNSSQPSRKQADQAMNNLVNDGSREALVAAIRARREAGSKTAGARELVSV